MDDKTGASIVGLGLAVDFLVCLVGEQVRRGLLDMGSVERILDQSLRNTGAANPDHRAGLQSMADLLRSRVVRMAGLDTPGSG